MWPSVDDDSNNNVDDNIYVSENRRGSYTPKYPHIEQNRKSSIVSLEEISETKLSPPPPQQEQQQQEEEEKLQPTPPPPPPQQQQPKEAIPVSSNNIDILNTIIEEHEPLLNNGYNKSLEDIQQCTEIMAYQLYKSIVLKKDTDVSTEFFRPSVCIVTLINASSLMVRMLRIPKHSIILPNRSSYKIHPGGDRMKECHRNMGIGGIEKFLTDIDSSLRKYTGAFATAGFQNVRHLSATATHDDIKRICEEPCDVEKIYDALKLYELQNECMIDNELWSGLSESCMTIVLWNDEWIHTDMFTVENLSKRSRKWKFHKAGSKITCTQLNRVNHYNRYVIVVEDTCTNETRRESIVYEYERWIPFKGFHSNYLLRDEFNYTYDDGANAGDLSMVELPPAAKWNEPWRVSTNAPCDGDGWQYALSYKSDKWTLDAPGLILRRRRWTREIVSNDDEAELFPHDYSLIGMIAKLSTNANNDDDDDDEWAHKFIKQHDDYDDTTRLSYTIGIINASNYTLNIDQLPNGTCVYPHRSSFEPGSDLYDVIYCSMSSSEEDERQHVLRTCASSFSDELSSKSMCVVTMFNQNNWLRSNLFHISFNNHMQMKTRIYGKIRIRKYDLKTHHNACLLIIHDHTMMRNDKIITYENQRWIPFRGWHAKNLLPGERREFSTHDGHECTMDSFLIPESDWNDDDGWQIEINDKTDKEGWRYAFNFLSTDWSNKSRTSDTVRRRAWYRLLRQHNNNTMDEIGIR